MHRSSPSDGRGGYRLEQIKLWT